MKEVLRMIQSAIEAIQRNFEHTVYYKYDYNTDVNYLYVLDKNHNLLGEVSFHSGEMVKDGFIVRIVNIVHDLRFLK